MSDKLMDTAPGGETPQYESIKTVTKPHTKEGGQLSDVQTETANSATDLQTESKAERGEKTAENIRYGQGISEQGMGGQTTTSTGQANTEGGYGGTQQLDDGGEDPAESRREQGYGGGKDMDRTIGA